MKKTSPQNPFHSGIWLAAGGVSDKSRVLFLSKFGMYLQPKVVHCFT